MCDGGGGPRSHLAMPSPHMDTKCYSVAAVLAPALPTSYAHRRLRNLGIKSPRKSPRQVTATWHLWQLASTALVLLMMRRMCLLKIFKTSIIFGVSNLKLI